MVKVVVDHDLCEGHGRCAASAPEIFELQDDDQSYVLIAHLSDDLRPKAERAVQLCPRQAISLIEE